MRYFTPETIHWDAPRGAFAAAAEAYQAHLERLRPHLGPDLRALIGIDLQDALLREARIDHRTGTAALRLRCGCLQSPDGTPLGYFDLDLTYQGAGRAPELVEALRAAAGVDALEVLYTELDREPEGDFVHRLLFSGRSGYRELCLRFRDLRLQRTPRGGRHGRGGRTRCRFVEADTSGS